jgi:hypothetical protein
LNTWLFDEDIKRQYGMIAVGCAFEQEIQRLDYLFTNDIILIGGLFGQKQADDFVQVFCNKIHKIQLVLFISLRLQ